MNLANKLCYPIIKDLPSGVGSGMTIPYKEYGLTFRERLIIAAMGNSALVEKFEGNTSGCYYVDVKRTNDNILNQVDTLLKQLKEVI